MLTSNMSDLDDFDQDMKELVEREQSITEFADEQGVSRTAAEKYINARSTRADVNAKRLGAVQKRVLRSLAILETHTDDEDVFGDRASEDNNGWVPYRLVTKREFGDRIMEIFENGEVGDEGAIRSSLSRSIGSLIDRRLIEGAYKKWHVWRGADRVGRDLAWTGEPWEIGEVFDEDGGTRRPRLQYLRLTEGGREVAYEMFDGDD